MNLVALDHTGAPDFAALQAAISEGKTRELVFFAFDLLFAGNVDLRPQPLAERKRQLEAKLADAPATLRYVDHFVTAGDAVLLSACRMDLEGIVSKKLDAPYTSGRSEGWAKSKCRQGHEVVIGGWTTTGSAFRSLIAGVYRDGKLAHVGRIGTGYGRDVVAELMPRLQAIETDVSPFSGKDAPKKAAGVHWVRPELVAEIQYAGFTGDGSIRQASFKGLREDKLAQDVVAEAPSPAATTELSPPSPTVWANTVSPRGSSVVMGLTISHADKPLWPDANDGKPVTKLELAGLLRSRRRVDAAAPKGQALFDDPYARWHQRQAEFLPTSHVQGPVLSHHGGRSLGRSPAVYPLRSCRSACRGGPDRRARASPLELRTFEAEQPGRFVFDLDPAPDVPFEMVIAAALEVRDRLQALGLVSFCKTTGGKGLHIVTPLDGKGVDWPTAKAFARDVCKVMAADAPEKYLISMAKKDRTGRIFLDYLRNDRMATAVAPLSPRGRPGAPVSMPVSWSQVRQGLNPLKYTVRTVPALVKKLTAWERLFVTAKDRSQRLLRSWAKFDPTELSAGAGRKNAVAQYSAPLKRRRSLAPSMLDYVPMERPIKH